MSKSTSKTLWAIRVVLLGCSLQERTENRYAAVCPINFINAICNIDNTDLQFWNWEPILI